MLLLTLEKSPAVLQTEQMSTEKAVHIQNLVMRTAKDLLRRNGAAPITVYASEQDLNNLMVLVSRGVTRLRGKVRIQPEELSAVFTYHLPHNPVGDFVNLRLGVPSSESGLHLSRFSLGHLEISGKIALFTLRVLLDTVLGNGNGTVILNSIQSVKIQSQSVVFHLRHIPDLMERKEKLVERIKAFRDTVPIVGNPETVRVYYVHLTKMENRIRNRQTVSLAYFIGPLFQLAAQRSETGNPVEENKAALLAMAIYAGNGRFEKLIGPVRTKAMKSRRPQYGNIVLGGREDLRLHFIISTGIKIITDNDTTYAIGEFKELLDAGKGGSGFSFADLAADLAGTRLAETATGRDRDAREVQSVLAGETGEAAFFPDVSDLPEDLSQTEFERIYGNVESAVYLNLVSSIRDRISRLPAYHTTSYAEQP